MRVRSDFRHFRHRAGLRRANRALFCREKNHRLIARAYRTIKCMAENTELPNPASYIAPNTPVRPPLATPAATQETQEVKGSLGSRVATVALVGLGAALIEAELIPGILLGAAAMAMPSLLPKLGRALRPVVKETVRVGYSIADRTRESVAEVGEQFQDMVAEVKSEQHATEVPVGHNEQAPATAVPQAG